MYFGQYELCWLQWTFLQYKLCDFMNFATVLTLWQYELCDIMNFPTVCMNFGQYEQWTLDSINYETACVNIVTVWTLSRMNYKLWILRTLWHGLWPLRQYELYSSINYETVCMNIVTVWTLDTKNFVAVWTSNKTNTK